jgi:hypothetical protein
MLDIPPQDVAHADVHEVEILGEHGAVRALAAALDTHDDVFPHGANPKQRAAGGAG